MKGYILPGICGLLLGLILHWVGLHRPEGLRATLALRRSCALRSILYALGFAMAATALLCWLAVIDVDTIEVLPLSAGVLAGGVLFGVAAGLSGFTPGTAFAGIGGGPVLPALCVLAGCLAGTWALPLMEAPLTALRRLGPQSVTTLFQVTLDEPFLLDGGFLGQGCAGLLLMAIAACIPSPRPVPVEILPKADAEEAAAPEDTPAAPEEAEAFVALLPGEEPLVVDTTQEMVTCEEEEPLDTPESSDSVTRLDKEPPKDPDIDPCTDGDDSSHDV